MLICNRTFLSIWDLSLADSATEAFPESGACNPTLVSRTLTLEWLADMGPPPLSKATDCLARLVVVSLPKMAPAKNLTVTHGNDLRCYAWTDAIVSSARNVQGVALIQFPVKKSSSGSIVQG